MHKQWCASHLMCMFLVTTAAVPEQTHIIPPPSNTHTHTHTHTNTHTHKYTGERERGKAEKNIFPLLMCMVIHYGHTAATDEVKGQSLHSASPIMHAPLAIVAISGPQGGQCKQCKALMLTPTHARTRTHTITTTNTHTHTHTHARTHAHTHVHTQTHTLNHDTYIRSGMTPYAQHTLTMTRTHIHTHAHTHGRTHTC